MIFDIVFSEQAERDLYEIGNWYNNIRQGLKEEFLLSLEVEMEILARAPLIYKEYIGDVRKARTSRFPYGVYYRIEEKRVVVLAIIHQKRSWKVMLEKLKDK